jgi:hypothetical protein
VFNSFNSVDPENPLRKLGKIRGPITRETLERATPCSLVEVSCHFEGTAVKFYPIARCHIPDGNRVFLVTTARTEKFQTNGYSQANNVTYLTSRCGSHVISMYCINTSQISHCTKVLHIVPIIKMQSKIMT